MRIIPDSMQVPVHALARWIVLLMGWVWLGEQGQRLNWSIASGLPTIALWWTLRLVLARSTLWNKAPSNRQVVVLGTLTSLGAVLIANAPAGPLSFWGLMALGSLWAFWSSALDANPLAVGRCRGPWAGLPPVLAALMTWGALSIHMSLIMPGSGVAMLLFLAALLPLSSAPAARHDLQPPATAPGTSSGLAQTSMGLMMGSLWLNGSWCGGVGWSTSTVIGLHLMLMATMPGLVRLDLLPHELPPTINRALPLALVAGGGMFLFETPTLVHCITGMLLLLVAWALPSRSTAPVETPIFGPLGRWAPLFGPALLVAVGMCTPFLGPTALAIAYGVLGAMGAITFLMVLALHVRQQPPRPTHQSAWKDASS